jgi:enoyl-CoA hydratase
MPTPFVRVEQSGEILFVILDRPDNGNQITAQMLRDIRHALSRAACDETIDVVVFAAEGTDFCTGLDLEELSSLATGRALAEAVFASSYPWPPIDKPIIGAINGRAERGGLELALHCDILITSTSASFADTHSSLGIVPTLGTTALLPLAVGSGVARRMSLSGEALTAQRAYDLGFVTEIVAPEDLLGAATRLANKISSCSQPAVRALTHSYHRSQANKTSEDLMLELTTAIRHLETGSLEDFLSNAVHEVLVHRAARGDN